MAVGILAMMGFNFVDTYFVGQLGTLPLAAMTTTFPLVMTVMSLSLGLSVSTSIAVSHAVGGGDFERVRRLTTDALSLGVIMGIALMGIAFATLHPLLNAISGTLPTHDLAARYMTIWYSGLMAVVLPTIANMAIRATGDTLTPSVLMIVGVGVNAILDPIMIFGWGPVPRMEIAGAAWATVIARTVTLVLALAILIGREKMVTSPFVGIQTLIASWRLLIRTAVPIAVNNLITPVTGAAITRLTATVGTAAVAGFGIVNRVESFGLTAVYALQSVIGLFVGQNMGAGKWGRVQRAANRAERFAFSWGGFLFLLLLIVGRRLAAQFNPDEAVDSVAALYFMVAGVGFAFRGIYLVSSAGLNALNHAVAATLLTILKGIVITIPAAWLAGRVWGVAGIFAGIGLGNIVTGVATSICLKRAISAEANKSQSPVN
jgi:putative MATE family efflux protein